MIGRTKSAEMNETRKNQLTREAKAATAVVLTSLSNATIETTTDEMMKGRLKQTYPQSHATEPHQKN